MIFNPIAYFVYIILCAIVALQGDDHRCGWLYPLLISIFFTPIAGMFIVLTSQHKNTHVFQQEFLDYLRKLKRDS